MSNITIAEAKDKKHQLERAIAELLLNYSDETGVSVEHVNITAALNGPGKVVQYIVEIEANI